MSWCPRRVLVGLALVVVVACAPALITTGEALSALEKQFLETAERYDQLHTAGRISDVSHQRWTEFAVKFVAQWNRAADLWDRAAAQNDPEAARDARTIVNALRRELTTLALDLTRERR